MLDDPRVENEVYSAKSTYLQTESGSLPWYDEEIRTQIRSNHVSVATLEPNAAYVYDSRNFHRPPRFAPLDEVRRDIQYRLIVRVNTPPENFHQDVPTVHTPVEQQNSYYVPFDEEETRWKRRIIPL